MPCHVDAPHVDINSHLEMMLELACRYLSKEQIISISPSADWIGLCQTTLAHKWVKLQVSPWLHVPRLY